jgi:ribose 5-phosphate isomerase B
MIIAIGCDHGGYELKLKIVEHLTKKGFTVKDFGCDSNNSVDYPDHAYPVCNAVVSGECEKGILICGTGIGMSIAANKVKGIRCALCGDTFSAHATREHNDSNVIAMGARVIGENLALDIVDTWLGTDFSGDARHVARIKKITAIENGEL